MRILASALALAFAGAPAAALACTPAPGYSVPTNLQLADAADAIVLGQVIGGTAGAPLEAAASNIQVRPIAAFKGLLPSGTLVLPGMMLAGPGDPAVQAESDPLAFGDAHPSAYSGACIRRTFAPGAQVLFFLKRVDGEWAPAGGPFSRWAEDVASDTAPWVQLAAFYAEAARLPPAERTAALEEQREALLVHPDNPEAVAMAADIERALAGPAAPLVEAPPVELPAGLPAPEEPAAAAAEGLDEVQAAIDSFGEGE